MEIFNPQRAINTLRDNIVLIQDLGEEIENKYIELIAAKGNLADSEQSARMAIFEDKEPLKVSEIRDWMKWKTAKEQKEHDILEQELKLLKHKLEILIEANNATKAAFKIAEMEAQNLNAR